jgi:Uma2 family endonuclease
MLATKEKTEFWTAKRLFERFGPIPLARIRTVPEPGSATEEDVVAINDHENRLCELVDGILVEKTVGAYESILAMEIGRLLGNWVKPRKLGVVLGADGMLKLAPGLIRIPDVAYLSIEKFPSGRFPRAAAPRLAPDLAVEVLSRHNTKQEMAEKLNDYFVAGSRLVWYVDPKPREVAVYTSPKRKRMVRGTQKLEGGDVLPGLIIDLAELFSDLPLE